MGLRYGGPMVNTVSLVLALVLAASEQAAPAPPHAVARAASMVVPALHLEDPGPWATAEFEAADEAIVSVWRRAVKELEAQRAAGFSEAYLEPIGPFWGDMAVTARAYAAWAGDPVLFRASLERAFHPALRPPLHEGHRSLAAYSLMWPGLLLHYYEHTGDEQYTREIARHLIPSLFAFYDEYAQPSGLLSGAKLPPWPDALLTGFDPAATAGPNAVLNAFYYHALKQAAALNQAVRFNDVDYAADAQAVRRAYRDAFLRPERNLFADAPGSASISVLSNGLAVCFGLADAPEEAAILTLIREQGAVCAAAFRPYVIEAAFRLGAVQLGYDMLTFTNGSEADPSAVYLIAEYLGGIRPAGPAWSSARLAPRFPDRLDRARLVVPVTTGRITVKYARDTGARVLMPPGVNAYVAPNLGVPVMVKTTISHGEYSLSPEQMRLLESKGWSERVKDGAAVWISVAEQMLRYIQGDRVLYQARCATAANGVGSQLNSLQTPLGWHSVARKVGADAPWGQVFRARAATREIWQPGEDTKEDLVLTRILLLTGEEPGLNKGGDVDSLARNIYIHGTNDEARLGVPSSHGCIRLSNDDVIEAFERIPEGTLVLITEF